VNLNKILCFIYIKKKILKNVYFKEDFSVLNSGKKNYALRDKKNKYSNSCVVRKKNSERNKKPYSPPPSN
jgi:hypothetical protein